MKEVCPFSRFTASAYCCAIKRRLSLSPSGRRSIRLIIFSSINLMYSDIRRPYRSGLAGDTFTDSQSNQSLHLPRDITPPLLARKSHDVINGRTETEPLPPLINDHIDFLLRRSHTPHLFSGDPKRQGGCFSIHKSIDALQKKDPLPPLVRTITLPRDNVTVWYKLVIFGLHGYWFGEVSGLDVWITMTYCRRIACRI